MQKNSGKQRFTHPFLREHLGHLHPNLPIRIFAKMSLENKNLNSQSKEYSPTLRRNRSLENRKETGSSQAINKVNLTKLQSQKISKKHQIRKELSRMQSQISRYSPEKKYQKITPHYHKISNKESLFRPNAIESDPNQQTKNTEIVPIFYKSQQRYEISIPVEVGINETSEEINTRNIQDTKFDKLLEMNLCNQDINLEIQSKFAFVKRKSAQIEPETCQVEIYNIHEKLLEEENYYLRQQLHQFAIIIESQKHRVESTRQKNYMMKRQIKKLKQQISELQTSKDFLQKEIMSRENAYFTMSSQTEANSKKIALLQQSKQNLQCKLEQVQKEYEKLQSKCKQFQCKKDKEIQLILDQKLRDKQSFEEQLCEKDKEIYELQQFIKELRQKYNKNDIQDKEMSSDDQSSRRSSEEEISITQERSNSICLSLAEAQSLKNIIEAKEDSHQLQIATLKNNYIQRECQTRQQIVKLTQRIQQLQRQLTNLNLGDIQYSKQDHEETNETNYLQIQDDWRGQISQQLLKINHLSKIQKLERFLLEEREEKMRLVGKITKLQQDCLQVSKQQDEQVQFLLQNCVNELQKQRQYASRLQQENEYFRKMLGNKLVYIKQR